ncbi:HAD-IIIA family hydrolase [Paenibacillus xylanexedens]|uniref:HAD-IIIA family hydrolase n=1 Tax=Paenibacillus xylanexedens TaxID=528191 RepID=UPI00119EA32B|nr:HAD-IIIA family hydrolase [Paenibacillus xylanexedens]
MNTPHIRNFPTQAVFIDRDGTIGGSDQIEYPGEMQLFDGVAESISTLSQHGFELFGFTNQPGITAGHSTVEAFQQEMKLFGIEHTYVCPHPAHAQCECRKPRPDMLIQAAEDHHLNLEQCIVIGDRWSDMVAARAAGCLCVLVRTGAGMRALQEDRSRWETMEADYVATDFNDAVKWIVQRRVQPPQDIVIRQVASEDAAALLELHRALDRESMYMLYNSGERKSTIQAQARFIDQLNESPNSTTWLAEHQGRVIGHLTVIGGGAERIRHRASIVIGVRKAYAGRGIGTRLMAALEMWRSSAGITRLELTVMSHNHTAIGLYHKIGFVQEGKKVKSLLVDGAYVDEYMMSKLYERDAD